ncbi:MAG TPA: peptidylprolyl isomerase [Smithellaceae bacterium]|nr:peptidylprolyl isomerase [Smithellaceae bacterium]
MKYYKTIVLSILFLMLVSWSVQAEVADRIIAVVNDEVITLKEYNEALQPYLQKIEEAYQGKDKAIVVKQTKDAILQRLIDNLLIEYEAKKRGTNIKDEEVMNVLKDMLTRQNLEMKDYLKKLAKEGTSLEAVKSEIRSQLMRMRLMRLEVKSKILVSDQEIGEYYDRHRDEYEGKEAVRIKQILLLISPNSSAAAVAKLKEDAGKIQKRALGGESFDALAAKYSQGPAAAQGGDVGFIEKGGMIPEIEKAAFSLPQGQVSHVIQSSVGFHIIKVIDKRGAGHKPITAVREEIKAKLEDEKLEKKYDEWITSVRKRSHIDVRL